jgi:hypothetical protein
MKESTMKPLHYCSIAILVLSTSLALADEPLLISRDTTYITQPLREDGRGVDYFGALEQRYTPETMMTDDNGYRMVVRALGNLDQTDYQTYTSPGGEPDYSPEELAAFAAQTYEKLGLDPSIEPTMTYQSAYDFLDDYREANEIEGDPHEQWDKFEHPWTEANFPAMSGWVEEASPALDLFAEAVTRPDFHIPRTRRDGLMLLMYLDSTDHIQITRDIARSFKIRAYYRIGVGDIDGAIDDVIACKQLGRHVQSQGSFIWLLVGIASEGIADAVELGLSERNPLTEAQLQRLIDAKNALPPPPEPNEFMVAERYFVLDYMQGVALGENSLGAITDSNSQAYSQLMGGSSTDWNIVMRRINQHYDLAINNPAESERLINEISDIDGWDFLRLALSPKARSEVIGDITIALMRPAIQSVHEAQRRISCLDRIHKITLCMLIYEQRHGSLPPPYIVDADGNPLHSWRVLILPYIGQQELYDQIRLDEPWDSHHNRMFHLKDVPFFACPSGETKQGETSYAVVVGEDAAFHEQFAEFGPKCIPQILVVERQTPVCWMDPTQEFEAEVERFEVNYDNGLMGSNHPGGMNVGMRSGSVRFISETIADEVLRRLLAGTIEPGEDY